MKVQKFFGVRIPAIPLLPHPLLLSPSHPWYPPLICYPPPVMDREDMLMTFEDHVRQLEKEEDESKGRERERERRKHRKNRDAFQVWPIVVLMAVLNYPKGACYLWADLADWRVLIYF